MIWIHRYVMEEEGNDAVGENVAALRGKERGKRADDLRSLGKRGGDPLFDPTGLGITPHKGWGRERAVFHPTWAHYEVKCFTNDLEGLWWSACGLSATSFSSVALCQPIWPVATTFAKYFILNTKLVHYLVKVSVVLLGLFLILQPVSFKR